jgi:dihydrodipicolinate synthase/N-acetylneuraminate lyase
MQNLGDKLGLIVIPLATPFKEGSQAVDFEAAARLAEEAENLGFDAVMALGPSYCRPT